MGAEMSDHDDGSLVRVRGRIVWLGERNLELNTGPGRSVMLPLAQIEIEGGVSHGGETTVTMPAWLARDRRIEMEVAMR